MGAAVVKSGSPISRWITVVPSACNSLGAGQQRHDVEGFYGTLRARMTGPSAFLIDTKLRILTNASGRPQQPR